VSVTEPVAVDVPLPPFTLIVTVSVSAVVTCAADGLTVTVGVIFAVLTVTEWVPDAVL
jgi:hypothetical protein